MKATNSQKIAILYPGKRDARWAATSENNRFANLFSAFAAKGITAEPAVYNDDLRDDVRQQLLAVDGVLVWVNPIQDGRDRTVLDSLLREIAAAGVFVSAHPDVILKLGTKEVLYQTRSVGWSCDTHLYRSVEHLRRELPFRLAGGKARVLKQYRGNGGDGVWKVQLTDVENLSNKALPGPGTIVRVRHAKRGCVEERVTLNEFFGRCEVYIAGNGLMIDQEYQERLAEGMIRCYLVGDKVAGFGHQAINALFPVPEDGAEAPQPGPRLYHPPDNREFQTLKQKLELGWVPEVQQLLEIDAADLPILWDCDFLLGPKDDDGEDTYVLCEINVSSVAPYPESAVPFIVEAVISRVQAAKQERDPAI